MSVDTKERKKASIGASALAWWNALEHDPGDRAELRRCGTAAEAVFCPATHRLARRFAADGCQVSRSVLPWIAMALPHVREHVREHLVDGMIGPDAKRPRVSPLRFRRLLHASGRDTLIPSLIRVLRMLDGRANAAELAEAIAYWGDNVKKNWAFAYYEKIKVQQP